MRGKESAQESKRPGGSDAVRPFKLDLKAFFIERLSCLRLNI
jgi:hypothetical protein